MTAHNLFIAALVFSSGLTPAAAQPQKSRRMSEAQQQNLTKLKTDAEQIKSGSQVTQQQKDQLKRDLEAMIHGATRPDAALVDQLAADLSAAMADGKVSGLEKTKLMKDIEKVLNSSGISMTEVNAVIADAQAILAASGVSKADAQTIGNDLKAIAGELKKNAPASAPAARKRLRG